MNGVITSDKIAIAVKIPPETQVNTTAAILENLQSSLIGKYPNIMMHPNRKKGNDPIVLGRK